MKVWVFSFLFLLSFGALASGEVGHHFDVTPEMKALRKLNRLLPSVGESSQKKLLLKTVLKNTANSPVYFYQCGLHLAKKDFFYRSLKKNPEVFSTIFGTNANRQVPANSHFFDFTYDDVGQVCDNNFGFCRGFTESLLSWNRLGHFVKHPESIGHVVQVPKFSPQRSNESLKAFYKRNDAFFEFYRPTIDAIQKGKAGIIYGFEDLRDFSSNPIIKHYLKEKVALKWAEENTSLFSLTNVLPRTNRSMTKDEVLKLHEDLSLRINELHYNPAMMVIRPTKESWMEFKGYYHVMQAFHVTPIKEGHYSIYMLDLDYTDVQYGIRRLEINLKGEKPVIFGDVKYPKKGKGGEPLPDMYHEFGAVSDVNMVPMDDMVIGDQLLELTRFYEQYPELMSSVGKMSAEEKSVAIHNIIGRAEAERMVRSSDKSVYEVKLKDLEIQGREDSDGVACITFLYKGESKQALIPLKELSEEVARSPEDLKKFIVTRGFMDDLEQYYWSD